MLQSNRLRVLCLSTVSPHVKARSSGKNKNMAAMGQLIFFLFVISSQLLTLTVGRRYGQQSETLHMAKGFAQDDMDKRFHSIVVPKEDLNKPSKLLNRHIRSISNSSSNAPQVSSVVSRFYY